MNDAIRGKLFQPSFIAAIAALLFFSIIILPNHGFAQLVLSEDFETMPNGSDGAPIFAPTRGNWQVLNGQYLQKSDLYDCGSLLKKFLYQSFEFSLKFRQVAGEAGAGIFFSSHSTDNTKYSQMVRFDGLSRFIAGYFEHGEYQVQKFFAVSLDTTQWHTLRIEIDLKEKTYSVELDGQKIGVPVELVYRTGYIGIQSSGGQVRFDDVELNLLDSKLDSPIYWPGPFSLDSLDRILLPDSFHNTLYVLNHEGRVKAELGRAVENSGIFHRIGKAIADSRGRLIVSDLGTTTLHLFDSRYQWRGAIGGKGLYSDIADVVYSQEKDLIILLESTPRRIHLIDSQLNMTEILSLEYLELPTALYTWQDKLAILDQGNQELILLSLKDNEVIYRLHLPSGLSRDFVILNNSFFVVINDKVVKLDRQGRLLAEFKASSMKLFQPVGIENTSDGKLLIADRGGNRFIITDSLLTDPSLQIEPGPNSLDFKWMTPAAQIGRVRLQKKYGKSLFKSENVSSQYHAITINALQTSSIYYASFFPTLVTVPPDSSWSKEETIMTRNPHGFKPVLRYPALCIIFKNVIEEGQNAPGLTEFDLSRIKAQILDGARFFWIQSGFNLWVNLEFIEVEKVFRRDEIFEDKWYYPLRGEIIDQITRLSGKNTDSYLSIFYVAGIQQHIEAEDRWQLRGRGGAFTNGLSANGSFGISWWEATHQNHDAGNNWLFVHEFSHQLDELFNISGYPDFWFNHFAPKLKNVGAFGEHFDGNSYLLQRIPGAWWFDLEEGDTIMVKDVDRDGIPDHDSRLPLDEARLNSSSELADTDADGVSDLDEVLFSNWVSEGHGEVLSEWTMMPNLAVPDTDNDEKSDAIDLNPLFAFDESIRFGTPLIDGELSEGEWNTYNTFKDSRIQGTVSIQWDSACLYMAMELDKQTDFKLQIDANGDGWFTGKDNWIFKFVSNEAATVQLFDAGSFLDWPSMDNSVEGQNLIYHDSRRSNGRWVVELSIDAEKLFGFAPRQGHRINFNIGFLHPLDEFNNRKYLSLAEPNRFIHAILKSAAH